MKILIIGVGSIGTRHFKNLSGMGFNDIIVCDPDKGKLKNILAIKNVPIYQNIKVALKKEKPEIVLVCTPPRLHAKLAGLALNIGANVFIEKPFSNSLLGINNLIKKADKKKKVIMVACNFRFHQGLIALKKILSANKHGRPLTVRMIGGYYLPTARKNADYKKIYAAQKSEGGVILDSASHAIDYLQFLFGKIKKSSAIASRLHPLGMASEEAVHIILEHESGVITAASMDYASRKRMHKVEVITDKGLLTLDFLNGSVRFENDKKNSVLLFRIKNKKETEKMFIDQLYYFFKCIKKNKKSFQGHKDAKQVLEILIKLKRDCS